MKLRKAKLILTTTRDTASIGWDGASMHKVYSTLLADSLASLDYESKTAMQAAAYFGIREDLRRVAGVCRRICAEFGRVDQIDQIVLESLAWNAVVLYGRCFDPGATGRQGASLHDSDVQKLNSKPFSELHGGLLDRRNMTFAHAGSDCSYSAHVHLMAAVDGTDRLVITYQEETAGPIVDLDQAKMIEALCVALDTRACERLSKAEARLFAEIEADDSIVSRLKGSEGKYASPEQQAFSLFQRLFGKKS